MIEREEYAKDQKCAQDKSFPELVGRHALHSCLALSQQRRDRTLPLSFSEKPDQHPSRISVNGDASDIPPDVEAIERNLAEAPTR